MATDPDAMWKPGYEPLTDRSTADAAAGTDGTADGSTADAAAGISSDTAASDEIPGPTSTEWSSGTGPAASAAPRWGATSAEPAEPSVDLDAVMAVDVATPLPAPARFRRRHLVPALALVALVGATVVVVLDRGKSEPARPEVGLIAAADERRIPDEVEQLWSTRLPGTGTAIATGLEVEGRDLVVAVVDDGSRDRAGIVGLDASTGEIRWRRSFTFSPPEVRIIGVVADRVILEQQNPSSRQLLALDGTNGETVWSQGETVDTISVILEGTNVIVQVASRLELDGSGDRLDGVVGFVDPSNGAQLGMLDGRPLSTDLGGTWFFGDREGVVAVDLSDGWTEPVVVSATGVALGDQFGVVDGRFIVVSPAGNIAELGGDAADAIQDLRLLATAADGDVPLLTSIFPAGGSAFVGVGRGEVIGAQLAIDDVVTNWRMRASMRTFGVTERGLVLSLSEAGPGFVDGVDVVVVDAVTGERLAASGPAPSVDQLPLIVGDGFIITRRTITGRERIGYDLDGTELWRMPETGKLRVGDELVVTLNNTSSGFRVTAYGVGTE